MIQAGGSSRPLHGDDDMTRTKYVENATPVRDDGTPRTFIGTCAVGSSSNTTMIFVPAAWGFEHNDLVDLHVKSIDDPHCRFSITRKLVKNGQGVAITLGQISPFLRGDWVIYSITKCGHIEDGVATMLPRKENPESADDTLRL